MLRRAFLNSVAAAPLIPFEPSVSFERDVLEAMSSASVPGVVVGKVEAEGPGWVKSLGYADNASKRLMTNATLFQVASLTKQVIAYAAFALRQQGKLDFDRTLVSYVDDLTDPLARTVTIRQVLSHSSGFPNWRFEAGQALKPQFKPGTKFQYSGEGYFYLQRILEAVSGKGICEVVEDLVFRPLEMTVSSFIVQPKCKECLALPHNSRGELRANWDRAPRALHAMAQQKGQVITSWKYADYAAAVKEAGAPVLPNMMLPNGASSLVTNALDYARFLAKAIQNPEIRKEQIRIRGPLGWGLGWGVERVGARDFLWQWGDNPGFKHIVFAEPLRGEALFVFTNGDGGARVYEKVVMNVGGLEHPALAWL